MRPNAWAALAIVGVIIAFAVGLSSVGLVLLAANTDTGTTSSPSGLEIHTANGLDELTLIGGCAVGEILKRQATLAWACDEDSTTSVTGAGAVALDLGDDDVNESDALAELAIINDTNSIFTEPSADKLLIDAGQNWPTSDTADALSVNPSDCAAGTKATAIDAAGNLTCTAVDISDDTNLTAGRSLTLTGDDVAADAELFTLTRTIVITTPLTGSLTNLVQYEYAVAATLTEVSCSTDTGTVTVQFDERARATPNTAGTNVLTSNLICDTDSQTTSAFDNAGIAANVPLNLQIISGTGDPGVVRIHVEATKDD